MLNFKRYLNDFKLSKSFIFSELPQDLQSFLAWLTESKDGHVTPSMYSIEEPEDFSAIKYNIQNDGGKINLIICTNVVCVLFCLKEVKSKKITDMKAFIKMKIQIDIGNILFKKSKKSRLFYITKISIGEVGK